MLKVNALKVSFFIVITSFPLLSAPLQAALFRNEPGAKSSEVRFESEATLETIVGRTHKVTAEFTVDFQDLTKTRGTVVVDLATLDTGINLRNKHMRENHLETKQHPEAVLKLSSLSLPHEGDLTSSEQLPVIVQGDFTLHGVTRSIEVSGAVSLMPASGPLRDRRLHVTAAFPVNIADYEISRPQFLFLKLAETVQVTVDFVLTEVLVD